MTQFFVRIQTRVDDVPWARDYSLELRDVLALVDGVVHDIQKKQIDQAFVEWVVLKSHSLVLRSQDFDEIFDLESLVRLR